MVRSNQSIKQLASPRDQRVRAGLEQGQIVRATEEDHGFFAFYRVKEVIHHLLQKKLSGQRAASLFVKIVSEL